MDRRRGTKGTGRDRDVNKVRKVRGGKVVNGFEGVEEDFVLDAVCDGEPVELLQDGSDVMGGWSPGNDASC